MQSCRKIHLRQLHETIKQQKTVATAVNALSPVGLVLSQQLCGSVVIVRASWDMGVDVVPSPVVHALYYMQRRG